MSTQSSANTRGITGLLLRCGLPSYRPSVVQSTIFYCQANKWLVSEAVSVYCLLILSLRRGWRGALHSLPFCSVTGKVLTLLISFFTALCQNIQLQTLKTSAIARHLQPHTASLIMVGSGTLFFEGGGRDDRLCEWKMIGEHNLKPLQLSLSLSPSLSLSLFFSVSLSHSLSIFPVWHRENIVHWLAPIESTLWFIAQFQTAKQLNCTRSAKIHPRNTQEMWKIKCHRGTVENFHLSSSRICSLHSVLMDDGLGLYLTYLVMSCTAECVYFWKIVRKHKLYQSLTSAHSSSK